MSPDVFYVVFCVSRFQRRRRRILRVQEVRTSRQVNVERAEQAGVRLKAERTSCECVRREFKVGLRFEMTSATRARNVRRNMEDLQTSTGIVSLV